MYIDPKSKIAGLPVLKVRNFLHRAAGPSWTAEYLKNCFKVPCFEARQIVEELSSLGYIARDNQIPNIEYWKTTVKGNSLGLASAARPLKRSVADKRVNEFLERVRQANNNDRFLYQVRRVIAFGSYLSNQDRLNDVDLAVELEPRGSGQDFMRQCYKRIHEAQQGGRRFRNISEQFSWPEDEVLLFLKSRSRAISLHAHDAIIDQIQTKVIFEASPTLTA